MISTSARLLRLLSLLQSRRSWAGHELAAQLEITERTVRRDVDRLRALGYPVNATSGLAGGYRLGAGAALPPLLLDDDEALAVALGLRTAASGTVTGMEESALRALSKLEQLLPARLRRRVAALHAAVVPMLHVGSPVPAERLTAIAGACREHERLRFDYSDGRARKSARDVEPNGLVHTGSRWYLVAFDVDRDAFRTFRVDRIEGRLRSGARFVPRPIPGGDLAAYVSRSVAADQYAHVAKVVLHAPYETVAQRIPPSAGRLTRLDDQRCLLETGGNALRPLALWVAMIGVELEVREPPELVPHLRELAALLARAADRSSESHA
ncbi:MAG: YafY family transcriptional regulator [Sandaracinaceae bacterium]|nr:YafY family transcriptional regulator [Sandaracinaceae bacterium]